MSTICEHLFERRDPRNTDYSMCEFDLIARLNMTIRKNLDTGRYELIRLQPYQQLYGVKVYNHVSGDTRGIVAEGSLEAVVAKTHELGDTYIEIKCGFGCPLVRSRQ